MNATKPVEILLVEDAKFYRSIIKSQVEKQLGFSVTCAETYAEAVSIIEERPNDFFLALLDLNLPDAPKGEIVDYVISKSIPALVFSGHFNEELRDHLMQQNIIDYVIKDSPASIEYVISTVKRLHNNQFVKVLLVDDSKTARFQMRSLLERYKFTVLEAVDGLDGLKVLNENPDTMLVITDYNMPNLDGFEFTKKIRTHFSKRELCIIGVSTYGNHALSAKFIKIGANDFITKPFLNEEFFCRVSQNIEMLEHINALKDTLSVDYLSGVSNRRYFYQRGSIMLEEAINEGGYLIVAMCDIDHFKNINNTYGHDGGDEVIKATARKLRQHFQDKAVVARFEGQTFSVVMHVDSIKDAPDLFDDFRKDIETHPITYANRDINVTVSLGITWKKANELDELIETSTQCVRQAKEEGRNRIFTDTD